MTQANDIVIVSGVRTAIGTFNGSLKHTHQHDLGAAVIREAIARAGIAPQEYRRNDRRQRRANRRKRFYRPHLPTARGGSRRRAPPIPLTASAAPDFRPWRTA
ncbi:3-ketoacyl-CoA thiolase [Klebsiella pneumoniae]|uniref:3-ketoacyl-CoA thiolase n=1 Tax=Klebsiella pneumoniae TaxID=573 RepID=A0A2X3KND3_KLEPN|nr:3-ketoacyl-CoA thiolase [Klebsiella pneumoniae]